MFMTAERVGTEFRIYIKNKLVAAFITVDALVSGIKLLNILDPANDGPEVDIINREVQITAEEF